MGAETITESDIWADIDVAFPALPEREPGDIDYRMMMDKYGVNETNARKRMMKMKALGYELIEVRDNSSRNGRINVIRRARTIRKGKSVNADITYEGKGEPFVCLDDE